MKTLCAIVFTMLAAPAVAQPTVWTVGPRGSDFPLIAPAIAASAPHDEIHVAAGVYREDLVIAHPLRIVAGEGAILYGTGRGTVIDITAPDVEIRGLIIDGTGTGAGNEMDAGIRATAPRARVIGNRIRRAFYGIVLAGASDSIADGNEIVGLTDEPFGRRGDGIYVYRSARTAIVGNRISAMRDAIYLQYAPGGNVDGNTVSQSRYGLHDMFSDGTRITGNRFSDSSVGSNLMNSRHLTLEGNEFVGNRGITAVGLALKDCDATTARSNRFAANGRGLQLDGSSRNVFSANQFVQNDIAIRLASSAEANVFTRNVFSGNWSDVVSSGRGDSNQWSADGAGNTWSAYEGFDFDGDGVGDTPHPLSGPFERIEGRNPVARLFLQSPAASALAIASRLSPVPNGLIDTRPLVTGAPAGNPLLVVFGVAAFGLTTRRLWRTRCSS